MELKAGENGRGCADFQRESEGSRDGFYGFPPRLAGRNLTFHNT